MRAGELRKVGTLQERSTAKDEYGGQSPLFVDLATVRFKLESGGGREIEAASSSRAQALATIVMRYRPGVVPTMRIVMGARIFNITNVTDVDERHQELDLAVIEGESLP